MVHISRRESNILGTASLAVADRVLAACRLETSSSGESAAGIVAAATFLSGATIEELSRAVGLTHSATVRLVDRLEAKGELERRPGRDGRSVAIAATASGAALAERALAAREAVLEEMLAPLSATERQLLTELNAKLLAGVVHSGASATNVCRLCDADGCGHDAGLCPVTEAGRERKPR